MRLDLLNPGCSSALADLSAFWAGENGDLADITAILIQQGSRLILAFRGTEPLKNANVRGDTLPPLPPPPVFRVSFWNSVTQPQGACDNFTIHAMQFAIQPPHSYNALVCSFAVVH